MKVKFACINRYLKKEILHYLPVSQRITGLNMLGEKIKEEFGYSKNIFEIFYLNQRNLNAFYLLSKESLYINEAVRILSAKYKDELTELQLINLIAMLIENYCSLNASNKIMIDLNSEDPIFRYLEQILENLDKNSYRYYITSISEDLIVKLNKSLNIKFVECEPEILSLLLLKTANVYFRNLEVEKYDSLVIKNLTEYSKKLPGHLISIKLSGKKNFISKLAELIDFNKKTLKVKISKNIDLDALISFKKTLEEMKIEKSNIFNLNYVSVKETQICKIDTLKLNNLFLNIINNNSFALFFKKIQMVSSLETFQYSIDNLDFSLNDQTQLFNTLLSLNLNLKCLKLFKTQKKTSYCEIKGIWKNKIFDVSDLSHFQSLKAILKRNLTKDSFSLIFNDQASFDFYENFLCYLKQSKETEILEKFKSLNFNFLHPKIKTLSLNNNNNLNKLSLKDALDLKEFLNFDTIETLKIKNEIIEPKEFSKFLKAKNIKNLIVKKMPVNLLSFLSESENKLRSLTMKGKNSLSDLKLSIKLSDLTLKEEYLSLSINKDVIVYSFVNYI